MFKKFSKIVFWVFVYIASLGFVLPELFSAKSNIAVVGGTLLVLGLLYRAITFINWEKVGKFLKENF